MKKRIFAAILSLCLLAAASPISVLADDQTITMDGTATTNLYYTQAATGMGEEFEIRIPMSITWSEGDTSFSVDMMSQPSSNLQVTVSVDPSTFNSPDNPGYVRLSNSLDPDAYVDFALAKDNGNTWINDTRNEICTFSHDSYSSYQVSVLKSYEQLSASSSEYTGMLTFNISSTLN